MGCGVHVSPAFFTSKDVSLDRQNFVCVYDLLPGLAIEREQIEITQVELIPSSKQFVKLVPFLASYRLAVQPPRADVRRRAGG